MKAWIIEKNDAGKSQLRFTELPDLTPGPDDLLLRVRAAGLNRADLGRNAGHYERIATKPPHPIAGLEAAGEVIGMGTNVTGWKVGDRVMGMPSGAYAEQVVIDHRLAVRMPAALSFVQAAALPVALFTAHDAVVSNGQLAKGGTLFIQAAASGVGIAAAQLGRRIGAAVVAGTASPGKIDRLKALGLTHGIDYAQGNVAQAVLAATGGRGADVIIDMVGAKAIDDHLAMAAVGARWVQIGRMGGVSGPIDLDTLAKKRVQLRGVSFRLRDVNEAAAVVSAAWQDLEADVASGAFAMPVERTYPLAEADQAQLAMRENRHFGKFILEV
jgi:NADPH2:quinone reductase